MKLLMYAAWKSPAPGFWFRIFGYGLYIGVLEPSFSERLRIRWYLQFGRWKVTLLRPCEWDKDHP